MSSDSQFPHSSPHLSSVIRALFPSNVVAVELMGAGDATQLYPEEAAHLGRAVPKRIQEFAAGRACARRALAELGVRDFPLRVAHDRQPQWPLSLVGSITHTRGFCAAVAAFKADLTGLGLDTEVVGHVGADLWPTLVTAAELELLHRLPAADQGARATLIFSAKEAFYKCQYPLTGEWLDFHDLQIEVVEAGWFSVRPNRRLAVAGYAAFPVKGRYAFHGEWVSCGVALGSAAASNLQAPNGGRRD